MPYVTLKNGNRIEAVDEFTGQSMAIEANREERKIEVDLGDGGAPVELDGADEVARQAAAAADAKASAAQASAAANAQAIEQANAEISRVENKEDQAISGVRTDLATKASAGDLASLETTVQQNTSSIAANTSAINNLATVARTGSYNDLIDKPVTQQVQADWSQSNPSMVDYIKNKPTIPTTTSELTNDSGFLENNANPDSTSFIGSLGILSNNDIGNYSVALGAYTTSNSSNNVTLVGNSAQSVRNKYDEAGNFATSIGFGSSATVDSTSLGANTQAVGDGSLAIGKGAVVTGNYSIQLGEGTNEVPNALSIGCRGSGNNFMLLDLVDGLIPDERLSSNIARTSDIPPAVTVDQTYNNSSTNAQSGAAIAGAGFLQNVAPDGSSLAIGLSSSVNDPSANSVALGTSASVPANGEGCVAIGNNSQAGGTESVAIGKFAQATGGGSIQIGRGTNNEDSSLYIGLGSSRNYKLLNQDGIIPDDRISSNIARTSALSVYLENNTNSTGSLSILGSSDASYVTLVGSGAKATTTGNFATAVGNSSQATTFAVSLGASAQALGNRSIAIGNSAVVAASNANSIQIGFGTNDEDDTLKVGSSSYNNYKLLDLTTGLIPSDRLPAMTGADGSSAGTLGAVPAPAATDNTKFLRGDGTWAEAGSASADTQVINFQQIIYDENNGVAQWAANTDTETNTTYPYKQTMRADCPFPVPLANSDYAKFLVSVVYPAKTVLGKELAPFVTFEVAYDLSTQKNYIAITHYSKTDTVATNYGDGYGRVYATIGVTYDDKRWNI